jgi:hypothetical protein
MSPIAVGSAEPSECFVISRRHLPRSLILASLACFALVTGATSAEPKAAAASAGEDAEIHLRAAPLQVTARTGYRPPPEPGARPKFGPSADEVRIDYYRIRVHDYVNGQSTNIRYLTASGGGGGRVSLLPEAGDEQIFQVGWLDEEKELARLRTANGWHLVALHEDGTIDARSADPSDPDTVLRLRGTGDNTRALESPDAATKAQVSAVARKQRLRFLSSKTAAARDPLAGIRQGKVFKPPSTSDLLKRGTVQKGAPLSTRPDSSAQLTLVHSPRLEVLPLGTQRRGRDRTFAFEKAHEPQTAFGPGSAEGPDLSRWKFDLREAVAMPGYESGGSAGEAPAMSDLLGIQSLIWGDRNEASGIYYYLPAAYYLLWNETLKQYDLSLRYDLAREEGEPKVYVRAVLGHRFSEVQRRAAEVLVRQSAVGLGFPFFELRQMPIVGGATTHTVVEALSSYPGLESARVVPPNGAMGTVEISWLMDPLTVENFLEDLRSGTVPRPELILQPTGDGAAPQRVPLHLGWEESPTYPRIGWRNGASWQSQLPHPIRLKGLHALVVDASESLQVLSWDLRDNPPVPPGASAFMEDVLPSAVASNSFLTWVDYQVAPDTASLEAASRSITAGVSELTRQPLRITLLDPLMTTGAARIRIFVRSAYLRPGGAGGPLGIYDFEADGDTRSIPFYLGRSEDDQPFEWTASVVMPNGESYEGASFLPGDRSLELLVSSSALRKIFGGAPWEDAEN